MKIQNALVSNIFDRSQRYFAHVTTVTLSWRVQNIVVIGRVYFTLECFEFSSNFEFDRNMLSGTGAWLGWNNSSFSSSSWRRNATIMMQNKKCYKILKYQSRTYKNVKIISIFLLNMIVYILASRDKNIVVFLFDDVLAWRRSLDDRPGALTTGNYTQLCC